MPSSKQKNDNPSRNTRSRSPVQDNLTVRGNKRTIPVQPRALPSALKTPRTTPSLAKKACEYKPWSQQCE